LFLVVCTTGQKGKKSASNVQVGGSKKFETDASDRREIMRSRRLDVKNTNNERGKGEKGQEGEMGNHTSFRGGIERGQS